MGASTTRRRRSRVWSRLLALGALVVVLAAIALILRNNPSVVAPAHAPSAPTTTTLRDAPRTVARKLPHYWKVRTGNTLAEISLKTGLSVAALQADNPRMHGSVLFPGERLSLWAPGRVR